MEPFNEQGMNIAIRLSRDEWRGREGREGEGEGKEKEKRGRRDQVTHPLLFTEHEVSEDI